MFISYAQVGKVLEPGVRKEKLIYYAGRLLGELLSERSFMERCDLMDVISSFIISSAALSSCIVFIGCSRAA